MELNIDWRFCHGFLREDGTNEYGDPAVEDAEGQEHSEVFRLTRIHLTSSQIALARARFRVVHSGFFGHGHQAS